MADKMSTIIGNLHAIGLASTKLSCGDAKKVTSAPKYRLTCLRQLRELFTELYREKEPTRKAK